MNISFPFLWLFPNFFFLTKHLHAFFYYLLIEMFYLVIDIFGHYFAFIFVVEWTPFIPDLSKWKEYIHTFPGVNCCPGKVLKRNLYISSCWNCIFFQPKKKKEKKENRKKNPLERRLQIQGNISFFFKSSYRQGLVEICLDTHGSSMSR